ncbi:hypothetical protein F2P81_001110 [Scophthalmus maximus]|uniref:Uncharacterized protein n=1 Tax=Scophthalmus maximus TaxID=52904 RepID=A0A6A4TKT6_SCOMX|nr:hypothetical protein F2P81_001110 [Scophthalmus maximus]
MSIPSVAPALVGEQIVSVPKTRAALPSYRVGSSRIAGYIKNPAYSDKATFNSLRKGKSLNLQKRPDLRTAQLERSRVMTMHLCFLMFCVYGSVKP